MLQNSQTSVFCFYIERPMSAATKLSTKSKLANDWAQTVIPRPQSSHLEIKATRISEGEIALKKLRFWIRKNSLSSEDAFIVLCEKAIGYCNHLAKLSLEDFIKGVNIINLDLSSLQISALFNLLDCNKDGFLNFPDWSKFIKEMGNYIDYIKDVIKVNKLKTDDVLKKMELTREQGFVALIELKEAIKKLDESMDTEKAFKVAKMILNGRSKITVNELVELLECEEEDSLTHDITWYKNILARLRLQLQEGEKLAILMNEFEKYDEVNGGTIDIANFKTCLLHSDLNLTVKEINRMSRYVEKQSSSTINYFNFLKSISNAFQKEETKTFKNIEEFVQAFRTFLKSKKLSIVVFLRRVLNIKDENGDKLAGDEGIIKAPIDKLSFYMRKNVFPQSNPEEIERILELSDIDNDGFISEEDLEAFLSRHKYLQDNINPITMTNTEAFNKKNLYPIKPLPVSKLDIVVRDLRRTLYLKKISFYEFFKRLDVNQDGFLTVGEFSEELDKIIKLSEPVKEGLFAYMDKLKIGMIDYKTYLETMNKNLFQKNTVIEPKEDNWDWQNEVINKIRGWFKKEGISVDDAFRAIDLDFDDVVSVDDLKRFLVEVMKYPFVFPLIQEEITSQRVDRLFKLIDLYKRGMIQITDFERILQETPAQPSMAVTGGRSLTEDNTFAWNLNAKQQIGLVLSRHYKSLQDSFDGLNFYSVIGNFSKKITYGSFSKWIEESQALLGFNLTEKLIKKIFAEIDPHRKGYLTFNDWLIAFSQLF